MAPPVVTDLGLSAGLRGSVETFFGTVRYLTKLVVRLASHYQLVLLPGFGLSPLSLTAA